MPRPPCSCLAPLFCLAATSWFSLPSADAQQKKEQDETRWTAGLLEGTGSEPLPFRGVEAFPGLSFSRPVDLDLLSEGDKEFRFLLTELGGRIWCFADDAQTTDRHLAFQHPDASEDPNRVGKIRFYSIELDPDFSENAWIYVSMNRREDGNGFNRVLRYTVTQSAPFLIDPASEVELLSWESAGHDGCDLKFGTDGLLYISTGDGEAPGDPANVGQETDNLLGSILRIDIRNPQADARYRIPDSNPFLSFDGVPPEIWAYGLRNPWRMNFHPESGELFVGDNGDEHWELVRVVGAGSNHGWSAFEGSHPFRLSNALAGPRPELTLPAWEHPHIEMRSVIGGLFYQGEQFPELAGRYLYGCYFTKKLWSLRWDTETREATEVGRIADIGHAVVSFSQDSKGEILVVTHDGPLYRLERSPPSSPRAIPETLSQTGLFSDTRALAASKGVHAYAINAPAWADGAEVRRHLAIPPGEGIRARQGETQQKSWSIPNGSAFSKTLFRTLPGDPGKQVRIETQVMHRDRDEWRFLTYRWRKDQSDAELVPESGETEIYQIGDLTLSHRFPSRGECVACHTQKSFFLIGLSTEQLNRDNQIERLIAEGVFRPGQEPRPEQFAALASPSDTEAPLEARARAYLHVNCAHCHRETGLGGRAQFQLLHWLSLEETGAINARPLVGLPGIGDKGRVIAPGLPDHSELVRRMAIRGPNQMPLISSDHVDQEGLALIRKWISSLSETTVSSQDSQKKP